MERFHPDGISHYSLLENLLKSLIHSSLLSPRTFGSIGVFFKKNPNKSLKSLILLSLLAFLFSLSASAQVGERRTDLSVGGSAGFLLSRIDFTPSIKQNWKPAPTFGFTARYICEKYFTAICGVQLEVNYANMGWKELIEDGSLNEYQHDIHYVQVPMLMQMGWGRERRGFKFVFEAGPQLGYAIGTSEKKGGAGAWDISKRPNNVVYQYSHDIDNKFEYGIVAGMGLEFSSLIGHFILDGRYYFGLSDTYDSSKKGKFPRSANQAIVVKLNYLFDLHKTKNADIK